MALVAPTIGDIVHLVITVGVHFPAIVMTHVAAPHHPITLFVLHQPETSMVWRESRDGDPQHARTTLRANVVHAPQGQEALGTWHWPEHRTPPVEP